ncbi:MAG TPA: hypothetical protein VI168_10995 [Croceibacterium sp.]
MVTGLISSAVLVLASLGPTIEQLDEGRFRVKVVFDETSPDGHANAQVSLARKAQAECRGKGNAVSEGTLDVNDAAPIRGSRKALELSEVYVCAEVWDAAERRF